MAVGRPGIGTARTECIEARMDSAPAKKLSVLVPVYNEEQSLPALRDRLVAAMDELGCDWEVVLADDGSSDGSGRVLDAMAAVDSRFKVVHLRRNFGQTAAIMAALDHSDGDVVVMMDADLQNDPADIGRLLEKLAEGHDVVSGWRIDRRDHERGRRLPSRVANWLISRMSGVVLHDYGCTLKAYRRWTLEHVRLYGEMHRFIPIYASWEGARVTELPVIHHPRRHGQSKYGFGRIPRVLLDLLVVMFFDRAMDRPMQFFGKVGLWVLFGAFLAGCWAGYLRVFAGTSFIQTPLPLLVVMLTIGALLCFFFGVLAEMMMRSYFAGRGGRAYAISRTVNIDVQTP
jgi:glycosyltransferase involved in cell wall biosynthesis